MFEKEFPEFKKIALQVYFKYGAIHRLVNCIEECSELQKCLSKIIRFDINSEIKIFTSINEFKKDTKFDINKYSEEIKINTIKEIADVYITIEETKYILNISDEEILKVMEEKINRGVR